MNINFVRVNRLFALVYLNRKNDIKRFKTHKDIIYQKELLLIITS